VTTAATPAASVRRHSRRFGGWRAPLAGMLFWTVLPVVCLVTIGLGVDRLVSHVNHNPAGVRGNFLVTTHNCQQQLCISGGTFTSDDRRVVAHDLLGIYRWKLGTRHRAVYNADTSDVIPLPAHWDPTAAALGVAGAATLLLLWAWCLRGAIRRARPRMVRPGPVTR
jgi:hypothetical protein